MKNFVLMLVFVWGSSLALGDVLIKDARLVKDNGETGDVRDLHIKDGRIVEIGVNLKGTEETVIFDAMERAITAGLIDSATTIGLAEVSGLGVSYDGEVSGDDMAAGFQVALALNPASTLIPLASNDGITRGIVVPEPGDSNFAGQSASVRFVQGRNFLQREDNGLHLYLRERDRRYAGGSRARALSLAVDALEEAGRFDRQREAFDSNELRPFAIGLDDLETLLRVRSGAMPLVVHVDRAADIRNVVDAFTAFPDLRLILAGAAEAWKVTESLLAHDIPVLINGLDNLPQNFDRLGARLDQAYLLSSAGVRFALMSGSPYSEFRSLTQAAGVAVANGLAWEQALLAITAVPAEIWGLEGLGKIDRGAKADLVIWSGDPLEVSSAPIAVMVDGEWVNLETRQDRLAKRYLEVLNLETKD